ncbi:hypothetical protein HK096_010073 [Nowakowskiella sp. JEL0078]|nr:hypothetical protein HK096_010073 [Nowakowskiella sp. JEL0078]
MDGTVLCNLKKTILALRDTYCLYAGDNSDNQIGEFEAKFTFAVTRMVATIFNKSSGMTQEVWLFGDWRERKAVIMLGGEEGIVIAQISRQITGRDIFLGAQDYYLTVAPGVDAAFMVMFCVAMDEFQEARRQRQRNSS